MFQKVFFVPVFILVCSFSYVWCTTIPYSDPSRCSVGEFFQFPSLRCKSCPLNTNRSADGLSCECNNGYYFVKNGGGGDFNVRCQACATTEVTSLDKWSCVKCPLGVSGLCSTCNANSSTAIFDRERNGKKFPDNRRRCIRCEYDSQPSADKTRCQRCHQNVLEITAATGSSCNCPASEKSFGGVCFQTTTIETFDILDSPQTYTVSYGGQSVVSAFFKDNLIAAAILCCQNHNFTACQLLGNLCVMLDYYRDNYEVTSVNTDACEEFLKINTGVTSAARCDIASTSVVNGVSNWREFMPWLYYSDKGNIVLSKTDISIKYKKGNILRFAVAMYTPNGSFVGIMNDTSIFTLCPERESKKVAAFSFLTTYKISCSVMVSKLVAERMLFYDLYYYVGDQLYPVPLLIENFKYKGSNVNSGSDKSQWFMTRRFFLVDNLGASTKQNEPATAIRYAQSVQLVISLRNSDGQIHPPYLKIKYGVTSPSSSSVELSFSTSYEMSTSKITENVKIAVGVLSALAVIFAMIRTASWRRRNDKLYLDGSSLIHFVIFSFSALSLVFFAVVACTCLQWLLFFKQQTIVYRVLPSASQETFLRGLLITGFVFKLIDVLYILFSQIFVDVFFIDWERPRGRIVNPGQAQSDADSPVSIIRTLFVANEWREIQTMKRINPTLQILLVLFGLKVIGFEHLTTVDPVSRFSVNEAVDYVGEISFVFRFAVTSIMFVCVAVGQWLFFGMVYEHFIADAIEDFVDFCSISNISIILLTHSNYGYYIHGRSVHGRADASLRELYENFKREEDDLCDKRGLESESDCQTFEVLLPTKFRTQYEKITDVLGMNQQQRQMGRNPMPPMGRSGAGGNEPKLSATLERSVVAYSTMNKFLTSFIEHSTTELDYVVKDKLMLEKLLDMELQAPLDKAFFYKDSGRSFTSNLLYGVEWSLLLFDILFFALIDMAASNYILAAVLTYFVDILIATARDSFGKKNLARKTLVHERFLI
eukprot:gene8416-14397_t